MRITSIIQNCQWRLDSMRKNGWTSTKSFDDLKYIEIQLILNQIFISLTACLPLYGVSIFVVFPIDFYIESLPGGSVTDSGPIWSIF